MNIDPEKLLVLVLIALLVLARSACPRWLAQPGNGWRRRRSTHLPFRQR